MKTQIIQIGNSQGIRIPKILLEESKIAGEVELELTEDGILIRNLSKPRANWEEIFRVLSEHDDDQALDGNAPTKFERKEWQW
jgi:antitoxin MazE